MSSVGPATRVTIPDIVRLSVACRKLRHLPKKIDIFKHIQTNANKFYRTKEQCTVASTFSALQRETTQGKHSMIRKFSTALERNTRARYWPAGERKNFLAGRIN